MINHEKGLRPWIIFQVTFLTFVLIGLVDLNRGSDDQRIDTVTESSGVKIGFTVGVNYYIFEKYLL